MNLLPQFLCDLAQELEMLANLAIIFFAVKTVYKNMYVKVSFSCGSFKIRRKDMNASHLTNLVSSHFFGGGRLPNEVRDEVIQLTNPAVKGVSKA